MRQRTVDLASDPEGWCMWEGDNFEVLKHCYALSQAFLKVWLQTKHKYKEQCRQLIVSITMSGA
jgi:hypothetical protein